MSARTTRPLGLGLVALGLLVLGSGSARAAPPVSAPGTLQDDDATPGLAAESLLRLPHADAPLWTADFDGDARRELASASARALHVWAMDDAGRFSPERQLRLSWPAPDLGFDLADLDGDGSDEVVALLGGQRLVRWRLGADGFGEPELLRDGLVGALPRGVHRVPLVRDIDDDGLADVVLPAVGRFLILRGRAEGGLAEAIPVDFESEVRVQVGDPERLDGRFGQDVSIPWFRMRDVDGDGLADLVSETEDQVLVHLASPALPSEPSWRLDLAALRDEVALDRFDVFELTRNLQNTVTWRLEDVDGVPPRDLVVQQGPTLLIYLGGSRTGPLDPPDDVLPSSGNVLLTALIDVVGDELPELHIVRIEDVTIGKLLRMLVFSTETTFEIFSYRNVGGRFERKTFQRRTIKVEIPALVELGDEDSDTAKRFEALREDFEDGPAYRRLCLDDDGQFNDMVAVDMGQLRFWRDALPESLFRGAGLDDLQGALVDALDGTDLDGIAGFLRKRGDEQVEARLDYHVSLEDLALGAGSVARKLRPGAVGPAWFQIASRLGADPGLIIVDLDGDGISDLVAAGAREGTEIRVGRRGTRVDTSHTARSEHDGADHADDGLVQVLVLSPPAPDE